MWPHCIWFTLSLWDSLCRRLEGPSVLGAAGGRAENGLWVPRFACFRAQGPTAPCCARRGPKKKDGERDAAKVPTRARFEVPKRALRSPSVDSQARFEPTKAHGCKRNVVLLESE